MSKNLLTPSVIDAVVDRVNQKRITNSKDLRKLRTVLGDPIAKLQFLREDGDLDSALLQAMRRVPWTAPDELRGYEEVLRRIDDAEAILGSLLKALAPSSEVN